MNDKDKKALAVLHRLHREWNSPEPSVTEEQYSGALHAVDESLANAVRRSEFHRQNHMVAEKEIERLTTRLTSGGGDRKVPGPDDDWCTACGYAVPDVSTTQPAAAVESAQLSVDANVEAVRAALLARSQVGLEKYGVTTERTDLSPAQWLQHLQEELMDAAVYIEALKRAEWRPIATAPKDATPLRSEGVVTDAMVEAALDATLPTGSKPLGHYLRLGLLADPAGPEVGLPAIVRVLMRVAIVHAAGKGGIETNPAYTEALENEAIEAAAEALWRSNKHRLLEKAGFAIDWASQPEIIKRDYRKQARAALAAAAAPGGVAP